MPKRKDKQGVIYRLAYTIELERGPLLATLSKLRLLSFI